MSQDYIKFTESTTSAAIDITRSVQKEINVALSEAQNALSTLRSLASAGGDLLSSTGGTITNKVSGSITKLNDGLKVVKAFVDALETAKTVLRDFDSRATGGGGSGAFGGGGGGFRDGALNPECLGELFDLIADGDVDGGLYKLMGPIGEVGENLKDFFDIAQHAEEVLMSTGESIVDRYHDGEIGIVEAVGGTLGAGAATTTLGCIEAVLTIVYGQDVVPDSWYGPVSEFGDIIGCGTGRLVDLTTDYAISAGKEIFATGKSLFERLMN